MWDEEEFGTRIDESIFKLSHLFDDCVILGIETLEIGEIDSGRPHIVRYSFIIPIVFEYFFRSSEVLNLPSVFFRKSVGFGDDILKSVCEFWVIETGIEVSREIPGSLKRHIFLRLWIIYARYCIASE
ncbi:MAG: hypothetical protein ACD_78C00117G0003 [uncultured bacterium (gcode 4)]|uniref:Uncharacterized protein n=1 Tax=uncultured bacterium (gcode 4) TaxID=1234023 RepID=K1YDA3_9BACT|nr:MAG: hypothetical protein ACD_78C00117G0003 [uncultured bacterium (gcode 4)]